MLVRRPNVSFWVDERFSTLDHIKIFIKANCRNLDNSIGARRKTSRFKIEYDVFRHAQILPAQSWGTSEGILKLTEHGVATNGTNHPLVG